MRSSFYIKCVPEQRKAGLHFRGEDAVASHVDVRSPAERLSSSAYQAKFIFGNHWRCCKGLHYIFPFLTYQGKQHQQRWYVCLQKSME